jgi:hypothetical protein
MPVGKNAGRNQELRAFEQEEHDYRNKPFVIVIEQGRSGVPIFMVDGEDGDDRPMRFATPEEARRVARGATWENAWVWWIVELATDGVVKLGTDVG